MENCSPSVPSVIIGHRGMYNDGGKSDDRKNPVENLVSIPCVFGFLHRALIIIAEQLNGQMEVVYGIGRYLSIP